jgi:uncharacterized membrane protein YhaH (DUF805 family)
MSAMDFLRGFVGFGGRISRSTYFLCSLLLIVLTYAPWIALVGLRHPKTTEEAPVILVMLVLWTLGLGLLLLYPALALGAKRLHDLNLSGWWNLAWLIPKAGLAVAGLGVAFVVALLSESPDELVRILVLVLIWLAADLGVLIVAWLALSCIGGAGAANRFGPVAGLPMDFVRNFVGFDNRIGRLTYFLCSMPIVTVTLVLIVALAMAFSLKYGTDFGQTLRETRILELWGLALQLLLLYPMLTLSTKRLHDLNLSGWWNLLWLLPGAADTAATLAGLSGTTENPSGLGNVLTWADFGIEMLFWLALCLIPGSRGANRFGPGPLGTPELPLQSSPIAA